MLRHAPKAALAGLLALLLGAALVAGVKTGVLPPGEHLLLVRLGVALFVGGQGVLAAGAVAWAAGWLWGWEKRQGRV
ncbi:MAG: hypothetical protein HYT99_06630 [Candidatus Tectomicrobia bacterium]|nr:hypothetical protein [Candidatus Tectomicrobia bacterium]MBI2132475.1 hypothetical protein [Candidatus Tectomicrobia bacterium]